MKQEKKPTVNEKTAEKVPDEKEQQTHELTNTLQRLQAEFDNYRKRIDKETEEKN